MCERVFKIQKKIIVTKQAYIDPDHLKRLQV